MTRWQGTTTGSGLVAHAVAAARTAVGVAREISDCGVAGGVPVPDLGQMAQHGAPESGRKPPVQRQVEAAPSPGEVLVEFPCGRVQTGGGVEDTGADPVGQGLQDGVVAFAGVGDPDQAGLGRGQQQRANGAVDGPVGDVEDAVPFRCRG